MAGFLRASDLHTMNRLFLAGLAIALVTGCATTGKRITEADFKPLFDGKSLKGWTQIKKRGGADYMVKDGSIICPARGYHDLFTEKEYADFILRLDFKLRKGANNGIG